MPDFTASNDMMSPLTLFLHADIVVKFVMLGLLAASIWTWAIIFTHSIRLKRINKATERFESDFWATDDIDAFHSKRGNEKLPSASILTAWMNGGARRAAARSTVPARASGWRRG